MPAQRFPQEADAVEVRLLRTDTVCIKADIELAQAILIDGANCARNIAGQPAPCSKRALTMRLRAGRDDLSSTLGSAIRVDRWALDDVSVSEAGVDCCQFVGQSLDAAKALASADAIGAQARRPRKPRETMRGQADIL